MNDLTVTPAMGYLSVVNRRRFCVNGAFSPSFSQLFHVALQSGAKTECDGSDISRYFMEQSGSIGMRVVLAQPRGFCAGVERAIEIVERAIERFGPPVYVRHEIVHNRHVVEGLRAKGAVFVEELDEIPEGRYAIFSAHSNT